MEQKLKYEVGDILMNSCGMYVFNEFLKTNTIMTIVATNVDNFLFTIEEKERIKLFGITRSEWDEGDYVDEDFIGEKIALVCAIENEKSINKKLPCRLIRISASNLAIEGYWKLIKKPKGDD